MSTKDFSPEPGRPRRVTLIGSTGSIGTQGLDVIDNAPEQFSVAALSGGYNLELLARQAVKFRPAVVGSAVDSTQELADAIAAAAHQASVHGYAPELFAGPQAATEVAGFAEYRRRGDTTSFTHTLVEQQYGGRGFGSILIRGALDAERAAGRAVKPYCPFVRGYIEKHPEYADLVAAGFDPGGQ